VSIDVGMIYWRKRVKHSNLAAQYWKSSSHSQTAKLISRQTSESECHS